jgi:hypothetical protein
MSDALRVNAVREALEELEVEDILSNDITLVKGKCVLDLLS